MVSATTDIQSKISKKTNKQMFVDDEVQIRTFGTMQQ